MDFIEINLAGTRIRVGLRFPENKDRFRSFLTKESGEAQEISVREGEWAEYPLICPEGVLTPFGEMYLLMSHASRVLLRHNRVLIHGAAFLWQGRAWLLTAPSGTGKTTQLRHWQRLLGEELSLIGGDKVVLRRCPDGGFWLHPAPWTGKEGDVGSASGPLAGIILLQQAAENRITAMKPEEAVLPIFEQLLIRPESEAELRSVESLLNDLLRRVPLWRLDNLGDEASARLTRSLLEEIR